MQKMTAGLIGLLALGALLLPSVLAHSDTGEHPIIVVGPIHKHVNDANHLDVFDGEDGNGAPCVPPEDENVCYYGDNDPGFDNWPGVSAGPAGWYYGSISAWAEVQAGPDVTVVPAGTLPPPLDGGITITPGFLLAAAFALCDAEILSAGTGPGAPEDETVVDGAAGGGAPDGLFNDGGIGAVCHTPRSHYAWQPFNTPGCPSANAQALDAVSGEDIWISTSCDWLTPAVEAGLLDHLLSLSTCAVNTVLTGDVPGGTLTCVNTFVACAVTGVGCPSVGASFCGADGVGDAGESGQGDAGDDPGAAPPELDGRTNVANGVPYPAGPFADSAGNVCNPAFISAATFVWNSVIVDLAGNGNDPDVESLSAATYGWVSTGAQDHFPPCGPAVDVLCANPTPPPPFCHVWVAATGTCI